MTRYAGKRPWLRLNNEAYGKLRLKVLERDGWRCQDSHQAAHGNR